VTCRTLSRADLDAVLHLELASSAFPWRTRLAFQKYASKGRGLVLVDEDAIVGYALTERRGDQLLLVKMAVHPDHRRRGHGGRLLREVERLARRSPAITQIRLHVRESNAAALALYLKHGYQVVETVDRYYRKTGTTPSEKRALTMMRLVASRERRRP
jgi:[ribosomal protein S18]-alanine N-acetyltransferase